MALHLTQLTSLTLGKPPALPPCLGNLPALCQLVVWYHGGAQVKLPTSFTCLSRLEHLEFEGLDFPPAPGTAFNHGNVVGIWGLEMLAALPALRTVCLDSVCLPRSDWTEVGDGMAASGLGPRPSLGSAS